MVTDVPTARLRRDACPVCGNVTAGGDRVIRDHISLQAFSFRSCAECGVWFVTDPPAPERLGEFYENESGAAMHTKPGTLFARLRRISIDRDLGALLRLIPAGAAVVDFGTGDGSVARRLHERGYAVGAVDMYGPAAWTGSPVQYQQYAMTGAPLDPALLTVDGRPAAAVILRHVLEHMIEPRDILDLANRTGVRYVFAVVPNADSRLARVFGDSWYYWDPPRHLTAFTPASLRRLAQTAGFRVATLTTSGVDEVVTSVHRRLLLAGPRSDHGWRRTAATVTRPTGLLAGLSSASSAFVARTVCRVIFESTAARQAAGATPATAAYTPR